MSNFAADDEVHVWLHCAEPEVPLLRLVCTYCRHFDPDGETVTRWCAAFPDGIPMPIWLDEHTHQEAYPGDHGIQFESVPGAKVTTPQVDRG